jgi:hypothetical protein
MGKVTLRQVVSEHFDFLCQFLFHRLLHIHHHPLSRAGTIGPIVVDVSNGLSLAPPQETKKAIIVIVHSSCFSLCYLYCLQMLHTVAYLLKERTVEPEKQPLLCNKQEWSNSYKRCFLCCSCRGSVTRTSCHYGSVLRSKREKSRGLV